MTAPAAAPHGGLSTLELVGMTAGKTVVNVANRWVPFFLPVLGGALGASPTQMTNTIGFGETAGFLTAVVGKWLDRGRERLVMLAGMGLVGLSTVMAIVGSFPVFFLAHFLLMLGVSLYTVGGHAYISRHVPFDRRGRSIGIFEFAWALGLFVGAPAAALLIAGVSWRAPFIATGLVAFLAGLGLLEWRRRVPPVDVPAPTAAASHEPKVRLTANAWFAVAASFGIAVAGLSTIVVVGRWMGDEFGISPAGVGAIAMMFGLAELGASLTSARFSDGLGKNRSTRGALVVLLLGLITMAMSGSSVLTGVLGLGLFFVGFEYAIVTSFSVVSEAMPSARGRVLSANMAFGTIGRGAGSVASGFLYEEFGIMGSAGLAGFGTVMAIGFLSLVADESTR